MEGVVVAVTAVWVLEKEERRYEGEGRDGKEGESRVEEKRGGGDPLAGETNPTLASTTSNQPPGRRCSYACL